MRRTNGGANGIFIDGTHEQSFQNCHFKTCGQDQTSCCIFSEDSEKAINEATVLAVSELRKEIHDLNEDNLVVGNGLQNYDFNAGRGNPSFDLYVDHVDGFCMEHVMAFEGVNRNALEAPFIIVDDLENLIQLRNQLLEKDKFLLVRSYPGPVGQPIKGIGGLPTPHLPSNYPYPQPKTNLEVQQSMKVGIVVFKSWLNTCI